MNGQLRASEHLAAARALIERVGSEPHKSLDGAITATDDQRATMIFSVFGVRDSHGDIVVPGAFTKSIAERGHKLPLIWNHDLSTPSIGLVHSIREVGKDELKADIQQRFPEATGGMQAEVEFFDSPLALNIYAGVKRNAPYMASYQYDAPRKRMVEQPDGRKARMLEEIRLHELTVCHFGSNPATYLSKAQAMLEDYELKAGRRHSSGDVDALNEIARLLHRLGATNITLIEEALEETTEDTDAKSAAPSVTRTRTAEAERILRSIETILRR